MKRKHGLALIDRTVLFWSFALAVNANPWQPTFYVQQPDGRFQVGEIDYEAGIGHCYTGVFVEQSQLPVPGAWRSYPIYALPELHPSAEEDADPWHPKAEDLYSYIPPPFPVEEREPPLEAHLQKSGRVAIGIRTRDGFFLFLEMEREHIGKDIAIFSDDVERWQPAFLSEERLKRTQMWATGQAGGK